MQGIVFLGDRRIGFHTVPDPTPNPHEVVVAIRASGMCGSDLHTYRAPAGQAARSLGLGDLAGPIIAGHEPCGVVVARGSGVTDRLASLGQRVMVHHYFGCGHCPHCRQGWSQMCDEGAVVYGITAHGAHAPFMTVPAETLVPLPDELTFAEGAAVSCGAGTAYAALRRLQVPGGSSLAVFGQGPVGLAVTMLATTMGVTVLAVDPSPERRTLAAQFGAHATVDPAQNDAVAVLREATRGRGVDAAMDCSGIPEARLAAVQVTRKWGAVCFVGEGATVTLDVSRDLLRKQLTLLGSWTFSRSGQAECARFVADRGIPLEALFTHRFALDQAVEAYRLFDAQGMGKGVFDIGDP